MKKKFIVSILLLSVFCGCSNGIGFLFLQDYQRDLLSLGLLAWNLLTGQPVTQDVINGINGQDGQQGPAGISCWDLNQDGLANPSTEDINMDGVVDVMDCRGQSGMDGLNGQNGSDGNNGSRGSTGTDGVNCWDLNNNGQRDCLSETCYSQQYSQEQGKLRAKMVLDNLSAVLNEDTNNDGVVDVLDCQGETGESCLIYDSEVEGEFVIWCGDGTHRTIKDGLDGAPGQDGEDGSSCTVFENEDNTFTIECEDGSSVIVRNGEDGEDGELGEPLSVFFDVLVEEFWKKGVSENGFDIDRVQIQEPMFTRNSNENHSIAWKVAVPNLFNLNTDAPLTVRMFWLKFNGEQCDNDKSAVLQNGNNNRDGCFNFSIVGKRLTDGYPVLNWGDIRSVSVHSSECMEEEFIVVDLPLSTTCPDGLGYPNVLPGDLLAFEISPNCADADYVLLGTELFSSESSVLRNAHLQCDRDIECDDVCN